MNFELFWPRLPLIRLESNARHDVSNMEIYLAVVHVNYLATSNAPELSTVTRIHIYNLASDSGTGVE